MRDKEKARQYNLQYRQLHRAAIRIKKRLYRRLPHVRKRICQQRSQYHHEYYLKHRGKLLERVRIWAQANKDKRRVISKRYKEKLKRKKLGHTPKIRRIVEEFIEYCKNRYKKETIRQYKKSMERFLKYLDRPGSRCKEYHIRRYHEQRKSSESKDVNWAEDFVKIRLMDDIDKELITNYVSHVNHESQCFS